MTIASVFAAVRTYVVTDGFSSNNREGVMVAKILIIDDEPSVGRAMTRALHGYETSTESNALCAIRRLVTGERFDLILCDLEMGDLGGKDIFEVVQSRPASNRPAMLMMSGNGNVTALYAAGCPVLLKPFAEAELRTLVATILLGRTGTDWNASKPEIPARRHS